MLSSDNVDIHVGIFEEYDRSLNYFSDVANFDWPETIEVKRATINHPNITQIAVDVLEKLALTSVMAEALQNEDIVEKGIIKW